MDSILLIGQLTFYNKYIVQNQLFFSFSYKYITKYDFQQDLLSK